MNTKAVHMLTLCALALVQSLWTTHVSAQRTDDFPTKPIRIIVPFAPGGPTDVLGRLVTAKLSEVLGVSVLIDNRAGANGLVGTELSDGAQVVILPAVAGG